MQACAGLCNNRVMLHSNGKPDTGSVDMAANVPKLMILPGDGVGPEVTRQARRVVEWICERRDFDLDIAEGLVGYSSHVRHGVGITDELRSDAFAADAILFGSEGGPEYDAIPRDRRGPGALMTMRKGLDLFANLRPIKVLPAMVGRSPFKAGIVEGVDMIILRELTGGIYFGEPRGIETLPDGRERGFNTMSYTSDEIGRIAEVAFELAASRRGVVHSVEKSNVMEVGRLWRRVVGRIHESHPGIELHHLYVDNAAMQLVRWPKQFDVLVTGNMFGDILSDCAAPVSGSLGMSPSASLGAVDPATGRRKALYEPIHGTAPDIAGRDIANPLGAIRSAAMMFRHSFGRDADADLIEAAVDDAVSGGAATADIALDGPAVSTGEMGDAVITALDRLVGR